MIHIDTIPDFYHTKFELHPAFKKWKSGGYGTIYRAEDNHSVLVKSLSRYETSCLDKNWCNINSSTILEACITKTLTNMRGFISMDDSYMDDYNFYIKQKYLGKCCNHLLKKHIEYLPIYIHRLIELCIILEKNGLQHCDIKTSNVLSNDIFECFLIDYNCMSMLCVYEKELLWSKAIGTWQCVAPEIVMSESVYDTSVVWSIGILIATLLEDFPITKEYFPLLPLEKAFPTSQQGWQKIYQYLFQLKTIDNPDIFQNNYKYTPQLYKEILSTCLKVSPSERISLQELYILWSDTFNLTTKSLDTFYHEIIVSPYIGNTIHSRKLLFNLFYKFCMQYNQCYKFCMTIHIFDHFSKYTTSNTEAEVMFASWLITTSLMNENIYHFEEELQHISEIYNLSQTSIYNMMWMIGDFLDWDLYEMPLDVWLLRNNYKICYDRLMMYLANTTTPYSSKQLYERYIEQ